jgi:pimeloyl-ACP methyl ester carboxylesterase
MKRHLVTIPLLLVVGYALICIVLYFNQNALLFHPRNAPLAELESHAKEIGFEPWTNARGQQIGWKGPGSDSADALLFCHGNGGYALRPDDTNLRLDGRFRLYLLEYPGYGARPGEISTRNMTDAAIDAIDTLAENPGRKIYILGESMGSGVACATAAARPDKVAGLALLVPFDSLGAAAGTHYPWIPVRLLMRHNLDSDRNLEKYRGPVAFLVAGRDTTIPPKHARRLYDDYAGPKRLWLLAEAGHNDFDELVADWPEIAAWLRSHVREGEAPAEPTPAPGV